MAKTILAKKQKKTDPMTQKLIEMTADSERVQMHVRMEARFYRYLEEIGLGSPSEGLRTLLTYHYDRYVKAMQEEKQEESEKEVHSPQRMRQIARI